MDSRQFALTGSPLGHSMSPLIHTALMETQGIPGSYRAIELSPEELPRRFSELRRLDGFNCTIPHKSAVIPLLDGLDERAALYGAVNTVKCGARAVGYNTDCIGFLRALKQAGIPLRGRLLVCGSGGVSRMMACEGARAGCRVTLAVREQGLPSARALRRELMEKAPGRAVAVRTYQEITGDYDLLVNGTPAGMYPHPEEMAVRPETAARCAAVFDCVYNPRETLLLRSARASGAVCGYGMPMLVWQAAAAQEIWNGVLFSPGDAASVIERADWEMERVFHGI